MHLRLAYYNIRQRKLHTAYLLVNLAIIMMLLLIWQTVSYALEQAQEDILCGKKSQCNVELRNASAYEKAAAVYLGNAGDGIALQKWGIVDWTKTLGKENWSFVNIKTVSIEMNNAVYNGADDKSFDFGGTAGENQSVRFGTAVILDGSIFSENDLCEYFYENADAYDDALICGRLPETTGEFVISDYMLARFGITAEAYGEVLNQYVNFVCDGAIILSDIRLVGIVDSNIFRCEGLGAYPQIILKATAHQQETLDYDIVYKISVGDYALVETIYSYLEELDLDIEYTVESRRLAEELYVIAASQKLIDRLLVFYGCLLLFMLILNLLRVVFNDMAEKRTNYGMMLVMGMNGTDIVWISAMELLFVGIAAMLVALPVSLGAVNAVIQILALSSGAALCVPYGYFAFVALLDCMGCGVLCLLAVSAIWIGQCKKTPYQMMVD